MIICQVAKCISMLTFLHCEQFSFKAHISITTCLNVFLFAIYSTAIAEPSFEHPSPRFTSTCSLKMTTVFFADISGGHRVQLPTTVNTADPDGRTRRSLISYNLHVKWRRWKTVDRNDPSRATTANPRVRSSRYARVMTTRVNGCSAAVFDRAWIFLTTGVRGFMKVSLWLYCSLAPSPWNGVNNKAFKYNTLFMRHQYFKTVCKIDNTDMNIDQIVPSVKVDIIMISHQLHTCSYWWIGIRLLKSCFKLLRAKMSIWSWCPLTRSSLLCALNIS